MSLEKSDGGGVITNMGTRCRVEKGKRQKNKERMLEDCSISNNKKGAFFGKVFPSFCSVFVTFFSVMPLFFRFFFFLFFVQRLSMSTPISQARRLR